jgi:2-polyprenyl-6-methoxyphenol hydroxylase-like FAD-dependent oxidoreductase
VDTGIVAISAKARLGRHVRSITPTAFFEGPTLVLGLDGRFLFGSAVEFPCSQNSTNGEGSFDGSAADLLFGERVEYVMWGFSTKRASFRDIAQLERDSGKVPITEVLRLTENWHPRLRELISASTPETASIFSVKSAVRIAPWETGRVTLLGDAIHNMTPYRGMGANMALCDSEALHHALVRVNRGGQDLWSALHGYEAEMLDRGFAAVEASLKQMKQVHMEGRIGNAFRALFFRTVNRLPVQMKKAALQHR